MNTTERLIRLSAPLRRGRRKIRLSNGVDLTGQVFGRLTVLEIGESYRNPNNGRKSKRWLCQCECGNTTLVQTGNLTHGKARSCGCLARDLTSERSKGKPSATALNISGTRFGRLVAVEPAENYRRNGTFWKCVCDCGNETIVSTSMLRSGNTRSCGCLREDMISVVNRKHGESHTRLYNVWNGMRQRCRDPKHKSYHNYGGRGIKVCSEWDDYEAFKSWALSNGYSCDARYSECTLDRIDVDGDYCPENCRWADAKTQAYNKRKRNK